MNLYLVEASQIEQMTKLTSYIIHSCLKDKHGFCKLECSAAKTRKASKFKKHRNLQMIKNKC